MRRENRSLEDVLQRGPQLRAGVRVGGRRTAALARSFQVQLYSAPSAGMAIVDGSWQQLAAVGRDGGGGEDGRAGFSGKRQARMGGNAGGCRR